jgi:hypothetical protein
LLTSSATPNAAQLRTNAPHSRRSTALRPHERYGCALRSNSSSSLRAANFADRQHPLKH